MGGGEEQRWYKSTATTSSDKCSFFQNEMRWRRARARLPPPLQPCPEFFQSVARKLVQRRYSSLHLNGAFFLPGLTISLARVVNRRLQTFGAHSETASPSVRYRFSPVSAPLSTFCTSQGSHSRTLTMPRKIVLRLGLRQQSENLVHPNRPRKEKKKKKSEPRSVVSSSFSELTTPRRSE